jgi:hypothetical protein
MKLIRTVYCYLVFKMYFVLHPTCFDFLGSLDQSHDLIYFLYFISCP